MPVRGKELRGKKKGRRRGGRLVETRGNGGGEKRWPGGPSSPFLRLRERLKGRGSRKGTCHLEYQQQGPNRGRST